MWLPGAGRVEMTPSVHACSGTSWWRGLVDGWGGSWWLLCECLLCNFYWYQEARSQWGVFKLLQSVASLKIFSGAVKHGIVNLAWMIGGLQGFFLLSFTSPIEVLCDSQRFCKPRVEKHWCNFSAVNRWGTSVPCSLTEKNVIISFAIVNWKNRRAAVEEWHKWILR